MKRKVFALVVVWLSMFTLAFGQTNSEGAARSSPTKNRVFELRTYTTSQGIEVFKTFFLTNTVALFKKYGFEAVGYWVPQDSPQSNNTFVYLLAFPDRETAKARWDAFLNDPQWVKARAEFIAKHGNVTDKIESQFLLPVEFSPLK